MRREKGGNTLNSKSLASILWASLLAVSTLFPLISLILAAGEDQITIQVVVEGTTYSGSTYTLTTAYAEYTSDWAKNPKTGANWTWSDIDTLQAGFKSVQVGGAMTTERVTQLYVLISGGSTLTLRPNATGDTTQWIGSSNATNWQHVNETIQNGDKDYVYTSSAAMQDSYNLQDHTTETWAISNVRVAIWARLAATYYVPLKAWGFKDTPTEITLDFYLDGVLKTTPITLALATSTWYKIEVPVYVEPPEMTPNRVKFTSWDDPSDVAYNIDKTPYSEEKGVGGAGQNHKPDVKFGYRVWYCYWIHSDVEGTFTLTAKNYKTGPRMDPIYIQIFMDPDLEFAALRDDQIDIVDWPLSKTWVDTYAGMPEEVVMRDYVGIDEFGVAINNQRWPTGCDLHKELDSRTGTYKTYYDPTCEKCKRAWMFRLAAQYAMDKAWVRTEVLRGIGNTMDTYVPEPALTELLDKKNLTDSSYDTPDFGAGSIHIPSLIYPFDLTIAGNLLTAAGFTLGGDGKRIDPLTGTTMAPIIYYIRLDDPNRRAMGERHALNLEGLGIPLSKYVVAKTVCFKKVMVEYDYHLYTEHNLLSADPDFLYRIFSSDQYWAPVGWSIGYQGFCHDLYDYYADRIVYGENMFVAKMAARNCTLIGNKYAAWMPVWCSAGVHGYRKGWTGVTNLKGYGIHTGTGGQYPWSFLSMWRSDPAMPGTIRWGFKSNLEGLSVITAQWPWDWQVLSLVYDSLIARDPYDLSREFGFLALHTPGPDGVWNTPDDECGWEEDTWLLDGETCSKVNFTLREEVMFHDGTPLTPDDVKFSLEFTRDCGSGVAWNYAPSCAELYDVTTWDNRAAGGGWGVVVYFSTITPWARHWAGYLPIFSKDIWLAANSYYGWGYVWPHAPGKFWSWNRLAVRAYRPWERDVYNPATGVGPDGIVDLKQDGTGAYAWYTSDPLLMEWVELTAFCNWYLSEEEVTQYPSDAYHYTGDINKDRLIDTVDLGRLAHAFQTWPGCPGGTGTGWWQWNPDCDISGAAGAPDGRSDIWDTTVATLSFGANAG